MQIINDLIVTGQRYQAAVEAEEAIAQAKSASDAATIAQQTATIAADDAKIAQLGQNALTDDEVAQLSAINGKINADAAAKEAANAVAQAAQDSEQVPA